MSMLINPSAYDKLEYFYKNKEEFYFVSDFDATLNHYHNKDWEVTQGVVALLHHYGTLSKRYSKKAQQQFDYYEPIELNTKLPFDKRLKAMQSWRWENIALLMQERLQYDVLRETIALDKILIRDGTEHLLDFTKEENIPFVVFSASSIGFDAIILTFWHRGIDFDPHYIVANRMIRDHNWYLTGHEGELIHSLNKKEEIIWGNKKYKAIQDHISQRPHAFVMGDQIHDAYMVAEKPDGIIIRVGILNTDDKAKQEEFLEHFDIVIPRDGHLHKFNDILRWKLTFPRTKRQELIHIK